MYKGEFKLTQTLISPVFCSGGHLVPGTANKVENSFLVDTGAGVSLLHEDQWKKSDPKQDEIKPWSEQQLVGVDGTPLHVLGSAVLYIVLSGKQFSQTMIIVRSLTAEAILGLNFLQDNRAVIDLDKQQLTFSGFEDESPWEQNNTELQV